MVEAAESQTVQEDRLITIYDARRLYLDYAVCPEDKVDQRIIRSRRDNYHLVWQLTDIHAAVLDFLNQASIHRRIAERFQSKHGTRLSYKALWERELGGVNIDPMNANLPRSEEDLRLDQEQTEAQQHFINSLSRMRLT